MSTILKALQRLEDEKRARVERSLDEQIVARRSAPDPKRRSWKLGFVAVAVAGVAVVAAAVFVLWPDREDSETVVAQESTPAAVAPVAAAAPDEPKPAAEKPRRRNPARQQPAARAQTDASQARVASTVEVVERLDEPSADARALVEAPNRVASAAEPKRPARRPSLRKPAREAANRAAPPQSAPEPAAAAMPVAVREPEPAANARTVEPVAADPEPAAPAPIELAAVAAKPAAAPRSVPAPAREPEKKVVQRAKLPALSVQKTIWHPDTERRIAIVRLGDDEEVLRLKEGDAVGPLVIESIQPGSVLFNHDGIEIRYNVGG